ncbi:MAG: sugar phosphate nucleotidyltransferase [Candidatus Micrarchaeia archaeon]|jgi:NDP-sugar pyrophosphorylase family protein
MQVIIPMSGAGDRFIRAGYSVPKPLIEVEGKPMIEHVVSLFPGETGFLFITNRRHMESTNMEAMLRRIAPGCRIVSMEPAKLGPVYAVLQAKDFIRDDEPAIVNYCDFFAKWNYAHFKKFVSETGCDGCIPSYRGFHPHSLGSTHYAYLRVDEGGRMLQIREKEAFTDNRMQEYASAGTYYFSKGSHVKKYFRLLMDRGISKNGEYYASLAYNLMNDDGLSTYVYGLEKFLQWGTPEDLEEYQWWSGAFRLKSKPQERVLGSVSRDLQVLMPMAGAGSRFSREGYPLPKPLVEVSGKPMFIQAAMDLPVSAKIVVAVQKDFAMPARKALADARLPNATVAVIDGLTEGQASTVLLCEGHFDAAKPLLIAPCDTGYAWDAGAFGRIASDPKIGCCVWSFERYAPAARNPGAYGWVRVDAAGNVFGISCKRQISEKPISDLGVTGTFYFRKAGDLFDAIRCMIAKGRRINGEFYVDEAINEAIAAGKRTVAFRAKYLCWGSPNELKTYQYWQGYFDSNPDHPYKKKNDEDFA